MEIRVDEVKQIAYIKLVGKVKSKDILSAFDNAVSSESYQPGMARLWDFTEIDLTSLEFNLIPDMARYSTKFPTGIRDVKVAFVVSKSLEYGLTRMFQTYSDMYANSQVSVFNNFEAAEQWIMDNK